MLLGGIRIDRFDVKPLPIGALRLLPIPDEHDDS